MNKKKIEKKKGGRTMAPEEHTCACRHIHTHKQINNSSNVKVRMTLYNHPLKKTFLGKAQKASRTPRQA